jgi:hypothetical protein
MNTAAQAVRRLGIDCSKPDQAAKRRLHVTAGTTKPVVEVKVTERGIEVVTPHQHHDATAKPDAFRISGGTIDSLGGFNEFVGLALIVLGVSGRIGGRSRGGFGGLILGAKIAALGNRGSNTE